MTLANQTPRRQRTGSHGRRFSPAWRAFTLVELLVVVSIIALLVAILLPELSSAKSMARVAVCQHRLHQISNALDARTNEQMWGDASAFRVGGWPNSLLPYLANNTVSLTCPEGGKFYRADSAAAVHVRFFNEQFDYVIELDGPFVAKMSDTQYQACLAAGYMHHGMVLANWSGYQGFEEDDSPHIVWYCMEEITPESEGQGLQSGDAAQDFEDVRMRVTDNGNGTFDLLFDLGSAGLDAEIVRSDTGEVLVKEGLERGHPRAGFEAGPFDGGFSGCSYGMNALTDPVRLKAGKILALDYQRTVAKSTDIWSDERWDWNNDKMPDFARHRGQANVLFTDGSVNKMRPQEINPADPSIAEAYWESFSN